MQPDGQILRLGTRGSLLAVAQSRLIESALRALHPELRIETVRLDTRGDRDRTTPLDRVADPDFFAAELDRALLGGEIDFTVHSMKDLSTERPAGIVRAAVPTRENPRDVVLFRKDVVDRLRAGATLRIGTSSTRRRRNVADFLERHLPSFGSQPDLRFEPLRGPVDERASRITIDADTPEALDGVVLALAGLQRLWADADGQRTLRPHLADARWMVLPLSACPAAPAQAALALECRAQDARTRDILRSVHDASTARLVDWELTSLGDQTDAATAIQHDVLGPVLFERGPADQASRIRWHAPLRIDADGSRRAFDGGDRNAVRRTLEHNLELKRGSAAFVAHWFAATGDPDAYADARVWVSGTRSWRELARRGIWVEGCADNLGFDAIAPTLKCSVLGLPPLEAWTALTRRGAEHSWKDSGVGRVVASYVSERSPQRGAERVRERVARATDFFWGSIEQYREVEAWLPDGARHACGAGKTAGALRAAGIDEPLVFPSRREWREWLS